VSTPPLAILMELVTEFPISDTGFPPEFIASAENFGADIVKGMLEDRGLDANAMVLAAIFIGWQFGSMEVMAEHPEQLGNSGYANMIRSFQSVFGDNWSMMTRFAFIAGFHVYARAIIEGTLDPTTGEITK
jgi:hypothetical protein